jgi:hypothetical protein
VVLVVIALTVGACSAVRVPTVPLTDPSPPPGDPLLPAHLDCARWRYDGVQPGALPGEWVEDDYRFTSRRDPGSVRSPQSLCGQLGAAADLSWGVERGSPEVVIAVLDSGIKWRDPTAMSDLGDNAYLNRGELPPPRDASGRTAEGPDGYDLNGDGRFSASDYGDDERVGDRNGNGLLDPEDLILTFSDGVDGDGNGYVDDISGWDFLEGDNNPLDSVDYGHGTGEARDAVAAHNGTGDFGMCPDCVHLPIRVSDSFIAEGGRFAAGVLFAVDSRADVVLEALGAISNPPQVQQAIDAAHRRGLPVVASMADEQSQHANLPAALNHTIPVNSVTEALDFLGGVGTTVTGRRDTLAVNGCTNIGGIAWVSVPSNGCSSEATGNSAGMVGLLQAAARSAGVERHPDLIAAGVDGPGSNVLSADEVAQLLRATADDVDFSTPNHFDRANNLSDPYGQRRFPSVKGWDATHGYGRINAYELVRAVKEGNIPPEADITSPVWFSPEDVAGLLRVEGRVAAVRSSSYDYRVEWTTGLQAPLYPGADTWRTVASGRGLDRPVSGTLAEIDLMSIAAALPDGGRGTPTTPDGKPDPDRFTVRLRVVVTDADGRVGTTHRHISVHHDPDALAVAPVTGAGTSSPVFHDLDGDGVDELVVATDDGQVSVRRSDGTELPGFPVRTPTAPYWPTGSATARADGITAPGSAIGIGAPAVADLTGTDGPPHIVVTDFDGGVHVWDSTGRAVASMRTDPEFSRGDTTDRWNRLKPGIVGSAALGDLDGDGDLEIVVAAMDRHVYAWHHEGAPVAGFPVLVVDPAQVDSVDPDTHVVTFRNPRITGIGGEIVATPAVEDLDGDGRAEIVVGAQEQYTEQVEIAPPLGLPGTSGNTRLYAVHGAGSNGPGPERSAAHPHEQAYLSGWPVRLPMVLTDVLPSIGGGVAVQAAIGDVDGDGQPEVVASSVSGQIRVLDADGRSPYLKPLGLPIGLNWLGAVGPGSNSTDTGLLVSAFGGPALGRVASNRGLDVAAPSSGAGRAADTLFANSQDGDSHLTLWSGRDGTIRPGFPRVTADIAFFVTPAIVDVDGDGRNEVVAGHGLHLLDAFTASGPQPGGWPKLTGGWLVGTPSVGDWTGDGRAELAVVRRDGVLMVWRTPTDTAAVGDWTRFGANARNSGSVLGITFGP